MSLLYTARWGVGAALAGLVAGCAAPVEDEPAATEPSLEGFRQVVPGDGIPAELPLQDANNNLSIARFDGRLFLAWRTAPSHFASEQTEMLVASTTDEVTWRFEGRFALGRDVREPQLVPTDDGLWFYFARLGTTVVDFEPGGVVRTRYNGPGDWTELEAFGPPDLVAWRIDTLSDGRFHLFGYTGGAAEYGTTYAPIEVHWLASDDGVNWVNGSGADTDVVLSGGGSETSAQLMADGSLVAVVRSEEGDPDGTGFGSLICTAPADDLGTWTCDQDDRKYDSPLLLRHGDDLWLIGRRQVEYDGRFDLGMPRDWAINHLDYLARYSGTPKRCSVWSVDGATRSVSLAFDLPSLGDTCFPDAVEDGDDAFLVYNYSNDPGGPEMTWLQGQLSPTHLYRQRLLVP